MDSNSAQGDVTSTYATFLTAFEGAFKDPLEASNYRRAVREAKQDNKDFNDYVIEFQNLCHRAGLNLEDQRETFQLSLNKSVLTNWRPTSIPNTFSEMITSLRTSVEINKNVQSIISQQSCSSTSYSPRYTCPSRASNNNEPGIFTSNTETKTYKQRIKDRQCTRCGLPTHIATNCPHYPKDVANNVNYEKSKKLHPYRGPPTPSTTTNPPATSSGQSRMGRGANSVRFNSIEEEDKEDVITNKEEVDAYTAYLGVACPASATLLIPRRFRDHSRWPKQHQ